MALIKCPNCGKEISDRAEKCPNCNYNFVEEKEEVKELHCPECNSIINESDEKCPNCGFPVKKHYDEKKELLEHPFQARINKIGKKKLGIIAIVVLVCLVLLIGFIQHMGKVKAEKELAESRSAYLTTLQLAQAAMYEGASESEDLIILTQKVWYNTIYEKTDSETDQYTKRKYGFHNDFNDSISSLYEDADTLNTVASIEDNQNEVSGYMSKLKNPTKEFEECYGTLKELYGYYRGVTELAVNPSGSLTSFANKKEEEISSFVETYETLTTQIPEE